MSDPVIIIIFILLGAISVAIFYSLDRRREKQTERWKAVATMLGFDFLPNGADSLPSSLEGLPLFSRGYSQYLTNLLRGNVGQVPVAIFDFEYDKTIGYSRRRPGRKDFPKQTVILFQLSHPLPDFSVCPKNAWHKIAAFWYRSEEVRLDHQPGFSADYMLRGDDQEAIRRLFSAEVISCYETKKELCIEGTGNRLVIYRHAVSLQPEAIPSFLEEGLQVVALFNRTI